MEEKDCSFLLCLGLKSIEIGTYNTTLPFKLNKATVKFLFV